MGSYNPMSPQDIGQEWAPIRDEDLVFSPAVNAFEIGHTFVLAQQRVLQEARFYLNTLPAGAAAGQTFMASVYPAGLEDQSGPIRRVVIPCNAVSVTGNTFLGGNAPTYVQALADPSDPYYAGLFAGSSTAAKMDTYYNTTAYTSQLTSKRILGVNLLCTISNTFDLHDAGLTMKATMKNDIGGIDPPTETYGNTLDGTLPSDENAITFQQLTVNRMPLGEINPFWSASLTLPFGTSDRQPWTNTALQRFEQSSVLGRYAIQLSIAASTTTTLSVAVHYVALEIVYCEEQRVAYGGRAFGFDQVTGRSLRYTPYSLAGANVIPMRTVAGTPQLLPVLTAGAYTVVLSSADTGADAGAGVSAVPVAASQYPILNALRELYTIPGLAGTQVNLPFPTTDKIVGRTFTKETTHILPQLTLHTSGGPLTEVHVYGRQAAAPVYGTITASQGIINSVVSNTQYPQVRFYARRFGATTAPLVIRAQATPTITASITVAAFDALPEILDGWKQVDLTFAAPTPSFTSGGAATTYEWISSSEVVGSRWEILGAIAPALSGVPGNLLNTAPAPHQLGPATYGGVTAFESWVSPYEQVTSTTADIKTDATVIFAQNMPTVSGFALSAASQTVTGIGIDCGLPAGCIPTGIGYHALTWFPPLGSAIDLFTRSSVSSFGSATSGQAYTTTGTATDYNVNGTQGVILPSTTSSDRHAVIAVGGTDHDLYVDIQAPILLSTVSLLAGVVTRYIDASNFYWVDLDMNTGALMTIRVKKKVAGVTTIIAAGTFTEPTAPNTVYRLRAQAAGTSLRAKVWSVIEPEPIAWHIDTTDTSLTTGASVGVYASNSSATLTLSAVFDNLYSEPLGFGTFEIQRMDALDGVWQTIMLGTNAATASFNDYEARVGILSSYRMRQCDSYNFCGPWTSTITGTLAAPGVFGVGDGNGVLIFTSNYRQAGNINLAYTQQWESNVEEGFDFREAGNVKLQQMYNRDYVTAFRPLERGGESFSRTILIQAASVSPKVLEDVFKNLRDMAWDTAPYICVRNELGDRWLATVVVPEGVVRRNRRLQLARISITETTETPYPVNPA